MKKLTSKQVAKAFEAWGREYMDDWDDLEDRRNKLCGILDLLSDLKVYRAGIAGYGKLCDHLGIDVDMD